MSEFTFETLIRSSQEDLKNLGNSFEDYITIMKKNTTWADDTIVLGTSSFLRAEIKVCCHSEGTEVANWHTVLPREANLLVPCPSVVVGQYGYLLTKTCIGKLLYEQSRVCFI